MVALLRISDSTDEISLIDVAPGIHLNNWTPAIAQYKGGGVFRNNPQATGRRLAQKTFDSVIETFDLKVNNLDRNALIRETQELFRLLEKATDYWTTDWQNTIVYLIAQAECEDNIRYAEIISYSIPQLGNPYAQPFLGLDGVNVFDNITLVIERDHWKPNIPGNGTAVEISATQSFDGRTYGRTATADTEQVFMSSKHADANLTDIYVDDGGVFGSNLLDAALPYSLLPAVPALNDAIYFGIETGASQDAAFSSLVFDIGTALSGVLTIIWEYWNGAWSTLTDFDGTTTSGDFPWEVTNAGIINWVIPSDWVTTSVNGVTGYWVRARINLFTSIVTVPTQQNRNVYSAIWPYANLVAAQVGGDIPALARCTPTNQVEQFNEVVNNLVNGTYIDRYIVGLRDTNRGTFTAYLNCSDQGAPTTPLAYTANVLSSAASFADDVTAPEGRRVTYNPSGIEPFVPRVQFTFTSQRDFYGKFHAFVRTRQVGGDIGDITIRLSLSFGFVVSILTASREVLPISDWQLVDMGIIDIPPAPFDGDDVTNIPTLNIEANCTVSSSIPDLYLSDLVIIPTDEWAGDFYHDNDYVDIADSTVDGRMMGTILRRLDIDSITYPKENLRAFWRQRPRDSDAVDAIAVPISNGEIILQANLQQRYWFLMAQYHRVTGSHDGANNVATLSDSTADFINQGVEVGMIVVNLTDSSFAEITGITATTVSGTLTGGTDNDWDTNDNYYIVTPTRWISRPESAVSVEVQKNERYLGMRGDR